MITTDANEDGKNDSSSSSFTKNDETRTLFRELSEKFELSKYKSLDDKTILNEANLYQPIDEVTSVDSREKEEIMR